MRPAAATKSRMLQMDGLFDIIMGVAVIAVALGFLVFVEVSTGTGRLGSYEVTVQMANAGGLKLERVSAFLNRGDSLAACRTRLLAERQA